MLTKKEKLALVRLSVGYAHGSCLTCLPRRLEMALRAMESAGDWQSFRENRELWLDEHDSSMSKVVEILNSIGVDFDKLNAACDVYNVEFNRRIEGCIVAPDFLRIVEKLLDEQS